MCLGSLSCWKVNLQPSLGFWMLWSRFSLRLSQYIAVLSFSSILTSPSIPATENSPTAWDCYQHTLLLGWYSACEEQSWFPSNMMPGIEVEFESEGPLGAFLQIPSVFSCVFTEERIESGHTDIKPRSVECCSDVCPSVGFSHLHIWSWSSTEWPSASKSPLEPKPFSINCSVWPWGQL